MGYKQKSIQFDIPVVIGTTPVYRNTQGASTSSRSQTVLPSAPTLPTEQSSRQPTAPEPDDDTVSIRTYTSTPPPFPDDGNCTQPNSLIEIVNFPYNYTFISFRRI